MMDIHPTRHVKLELTWKDAECWLTIHNRRSVDIFELIVWLKQMPANLDRDQKPLTIGLNGPWCINPFGRFSMVIPWKGQPLSLGLSYHTGDDARTSFEYELPDSFVSTWNEQRNTRGAWTLEFWNPSNAINEAIKRDGLTLTLIEHYKDSVVLLLGRDTGEGLIRLRSIQEALDSLGYYGLILKDMPDGQFKHQSIEEKLLTLASLLQFVLLEDSEPGGQIAELSILARSRKIVMVLRLKSRGSTWLTADYEFDFRNIEVFEYSTNELYQTIARAVDRAEEILQQKELALRNKYPWRCQF